VPPLQLRRVLWAAITLASVVMFGLLWVVEHPPAPAEPLFGPVLAVVAAVEAIVSFLLPRHLARQALASTPAAIVDEPDPDASIGFRDRAATRRAFADPAALQARVDELSQMSLVLTCALRESIAIFGLILGVLGFDLPWVAPFFVAAWLLLALAFPTGRELDGLVLTTYGVPLRR